MSDAAVDEIMVRVTEGVTHILREAGEDIAEDLREQLSTPGPSQPGQPPGLQSGALKESVKAEINSFGDSIVLTVSTDTEYDIYLEAGTKFMAPRPWAGPLEAKWEPIIQNRLTLSARLIQ